jgi:hypothetical protein
MEALFPDISASPVAVRGAIIPPKFAPEEPEAVKEGRVSEAEEEV